MSLLRLETIAGLRDQISAWRKEGQRIALVPTMGNLHAGHMHLVDAARAHGERVLCSVFVNPTQFGPSEDYGRYPRTLEADCAALALHGCDAVFVPSVDAMYPEGPTLAARVVVDALRDQLCGAFRPGHFDGVATIVAKLFNLCQPDVALFGEKDYQQLAVIRQMVRALDFPVSVIGIPTVRESHGLAMSSRNQYLTIEERQLAGEIYRALNEIAHGSSQGVDLGTSMETARLRLLGYGFRLDYLEVRDAQTLQALSEQSREAVLLVALHLGRARLIDNVRFSLQ